MERLTIYPSKKLKKELEEEAEKEKRSLNNLILLILERHYIHR